MATALMIDNGKPYFRVAIGLSKTDASRMANRYRSFGNFGPDTQIQVRCRFSPMGCVCSQSGRDGG